MVIVHVNLPKLSLYHMTLYLTQYWHYAIWSMDQCLYWMLF